MKILIIGLLSLSLALGFSGPAAAAKAKKPTYTITVSVGANGKVTPKQARVKQGMSKNLVVKPKKNYMIDALIVNGVYKTGVPEKLGKPYTLKLRKISSDTQVSVSFDTKRNPAPTAEGLSVGNQVSVVDPK